MAEIRRYKRGDFEYEYNPRKKCLKAISYIGPTGKGSKATVPSKIEVPEDLTIRWVDHSEILKGKDIENLILEFNVIPQKMPNLHEVIVNGVFTLQVYDCPRLNKVIFNSLTDEPLKIEFRTSPITIEYREGIRYVNKEVAGEGIHAIFGDDVEEIGIIKGGHVTLGKNVKKIAGLKKADFGKNSDSVVPQYDLPTRIDFISAVPPLIGSISPGALAITEIHVPAGSLESFSNHPQWGKAAYIVDEDGNFIDNYVKKHKERLKKLNKVPKDVRYISDEEAKRDKVKSMGVMVHSILGLQRLAKWNPKIVNESSSSVNFIVLIKDLEIKIDIPKEAVIDIWDKIVNRLEFIESYLGS